MASVKVAVRVRPFNQREQEMGAKLVIKMDGKKTRITNNKSGDQFKDFTFDHSYWSFDQNDPNFTSQEQVFGDLGKDVVDAAFEGYNACVFAYGQTGSGKTFTMTGSPNNQGLIPRICESLFHHMATGASYRTEVSYLEIYNERVKDLLRENTSGHNLRVREHPRNGPYVSDLSRHLVSEYTHIQELMARGNSIRTTASTNMNDTSSRSHAIFTLQFVQAGFSNDTPSETVSKVHLVDLAGSERADATGATGQRLKEGAHINKSLVTLGSVISALAELSTTPEGHSRKSTFIPYRDSVLTWLLKDSLGGNSKTIMIAAISPADCNYSETLSTLRYANRAKNIINKPTINEDPNVKLIKELRDEITKLKGLLGSEVSMEKPQMLAALQRKEAQEKVLTENWAEKWRETQKILQEQKALGLRKAGTGVVLDSDMPHLVGIDDNLLSTGVTFYHLKDGETVIGTEDADIVLSGGAEVEHRHCSIVLSGGAATLLPHNMAQCWVNGCPVEKPTKLSQGCHILLGRNNMFRYNDPVEAKKLRKEGYNSSLTLSRLSLLSWSTNDLTTSSENLQTTSFCEDNKKAKKIQNERAELEKEKEAFKLEQAEKEQDWEREQQLKKEALVTAQKQLEQERQQMEEVYEAQRRRLASDWQWLEQQQTHSQTAMRAREAELDKSRRLLLSDRDEELAAISVERKAIADVQRSIYLKKKEFKEFVTRNIQEVLSLNNNRSVADCNIKHLSGLAAEKFCEGLCWMDLTASADNQMTSGFTTDTWNSLSATLKEGFVGEIISHHKDSINKLEAELLDREKTVSQKEEKVRVIEKELAAPPSDSFSLQNEADSVSEGLCWMELNMAPSPPPPHIITTSSPLQTQKEKTNNQHVNNSLEDISERRKIMRLDLKSEVQSSPDTSPPTMSDSGVGLQRWDDSDDVSSNDGTSSYCLRLMYRTNPMRHHVMNNQCKESNNSKSMKCLRQKITKQRLHIIRSLESDINNIDTNHEIQLLQDLKREYIQLEKKMECLEKENIRRSDESDDTSSAEERNRGQCPLSPILNYSVSNQNMDYLPPFNYSMARSMPSLNPSCGWEEPEPGFTVEIPTYVLRGAGSGTHYAYEVRVCASGERWALLRRFSRFRELHLQMKKKYGPKVGALNFPSRRFFSRQAEWLARERRPQLEQYLRSLLDVLSETPSSPIYSDTSKPALLELSPFFRRGVFESSKYGTS